MSDIVKYLAIGSTSLAVFATITYLSPFTAVAVFSMVITLGLSYVVGFAVMDSYKAWVSYDENESRKKKSPSKDAE